ncbi:MAG: hypothetical protein KDD48_07690 [Bdellovibrionales bacterium]|nr:hypothetical protein [Bdellovibrionales bacterium]
MIQKPLWGTIFLFCLFSLACGSPDSGNIVNPVVFDPTTVSGLQIGVYVSYDQSQNDQYFIEFTSDLLGETFAKDALDATPLQVQYAQFPLGVALCKINSVGMEPNLCFANQDGYYWSFYYKQFGSDTWVFSPLGLGLYALQDGDLVGFLWDRNNPLTNLPMRQLPDISIQDFVMGI